MSLYTELLAAGIETSNHYSDLYFPATKESLAILNRHTLQKSNASYFTNQAKPNRGERWWVDVPFAYDPYWEAKAKEGAKQQ